LAEELGNQALDYDDAGGVFPDVYIDKLMQFYKHGAGTEDEPGNLLVTRKVCREHVLALLWDIFAPRKEEPKERDFRNPLEKQSARRFRAVLTVLLVDALEDLAPVQRAKLYAIAGRALSKDDAAGLLALRQLLSHFEPDSAEHTLITQALESIGGRAGLAP